VWIVATTTYCDTKSKSWYSAQTNPLKFPADLVITLFYLNKDRKRERERERERKSEKPKKLD